tara:strand:+ start:194 stop:385 length:192 start_codon:yes stop_codon:yes gene_type:complete
LAFLLGLVQFAAQQWGGRAVLAAASGRMQWVSPLLGGYIPNTGWICVPHNNARRIHPRLHNGP